MEVLILVPGVQDPESRRQARKLKRKDTERDYGDDLMSLVNDDDEGREEEEEEDDDSDDDLDAAPASKRQRL